MIVDPSMFDGDKFSKKFGVENFRINGNELVCPELPNLTLDDIADCSVAPVYSLTPKQILIAVGGTVNIIVTGAPDTTETITIDGIEQDVQLDDNGRAEIVATMEDAGNVYIRDAHGNIAKVEVA